MVYPVQAEERGENKCTMTDTRTRCDTTVYPHNSRSIGGRGLEAPVPVNSYWYCCCRLYMTPVDTRVRDPGTKYMTSSKSEVCTEENVYPVNSKCLQLVGRVPASSLLTDSPFHWDRPNVADILRHTWKVRTRTRSLIMYITHIRIRADGGLWS